MVSPSLALSDAVSRTSIPEKTGLEPGPRYGFTSRRHNCAKYPSLQSHCRDSHRLTVRSETLCRRQRRDGTLFSSGYMLENVDVGWVKRMMSARVAPSVCAASAPAHSRVSPFLCLTDSCLPAGQSDGWGGGEGSVSSDQHLAPRSRAKVKGARVEEENRLWFQGRKKTSSKRRWRILLIEKACTIASVWHPWLHVGLEALVLSPPQPIHSLSSSFL